VAVLTDEDCVDGAGEDELAENGFDNQLDRQGFGRPLGRPKRLY
jgi:hypothetical protein